MDMNFLCKGQPRLIKEWTNEFELLYSKHDKKRSPDELWVATMGHCSIMGEAIRRTHYVDLLRAATHAFCWICSYVSRCNSIDDPVFKFNAHLSEIVGLKYPQRCGHCEEARCTCRHVEMDQKKDKAARYKSLYNLWKNQSFDKYDLNEWLTTFWGIYSGQIHLLTLESIGFHFLEEVGENAFAIRKLAQLKKILDQNISGIDIELLRKIQSIKGVVEEYSNSMTELKKLMKGKKPEIDYASKDPIQIKARIVDAKMSQFIELADSFSWFCAVLIKLHEIVQNAGMNTEEYNIEVCLQKEYGKKNSPLVCPTCSEKNCACLFFS